MAEETEFAMGAKASCVDGPGGKVIRVIIDPATKTVTHLVIEPKHRVGSGRLVPLDLVDSAADGIRLRCTVEEFGMLEAAEEMELVDDVMGGLYGPMGGSPPVQAMVQDVVPRGETNIDRGEPVHALVRARGEATRWPCRRARSWSFSQAGACACSIACVLVSSWPVCRAWRPRAIDVSPRSAITGFSHHSGRRAACAQDPHNSARAARRTSSSVISGSTAAGGRPRTAKPCRTSSARVTPDRLRWTSEPWVHVGCSAPRSASLPASTYTHPRSSP